MQTRQCKHAQNEAHSPMVSPAKIDETTRGFSATSHVSNRRLAAAVEDDESGTSVELKLEAVADVAAHRSNSVTLCVQQAGNKCKQKGREASDMYILVGTCDIRHWRVNL